MSVSLSAIIVASGLAMLRVCEQPGGRHRGRGWGFSLHPHGRVPTVARTKTAAGWATAACSPAGSLGRDSGDASGEAPSCPALTPRSVLRHSGKCHDCEQLS